MDTLTTIVASRGRQPRTTPQIMFRAIGQGTHRAEAAPYLFLVEPDGQDGKDRRLFVALIRRGAHVVEKRRAFYSIAGAKGWLQHWHYMRAIGVEKTRQVRA